jgi:WD40 repeat protein
LAEAERICPNEKRAERLVSTLDSWADLARRGGELMREEMLRRSTAGLTEDITHYQHWADCLIRLGLFRSAKAVYERVLAKTADREAEPIRAAIGRMEERIRSRARLRPQKRQKQARELFERGLAARRQGKNELAASLFEASHELDDRAESLYWLGRSLVAANKPVEARAAFARALAQAELSVGHPPVAELVLGHLREVRTVSLSSDGRLLASGGGDSEVRVWSARSGKLLRTLSGHRGEVESVAFSPQGFMVASGGQGGEIRVWNARSGKLLATLRGHGATVNSVAFGPIGRLLVSAGADRRVHVWDIDTRRKIRTLRERWPPGSSLTVEMSPDGKLIGVGNEEMVTLWDAKRGKVVRRLGEYRPTKVTSIAFSPDGRRLASGGADRVVRIWDVDTGKLLRTLHGHEKGVTSVAFAYSGRLVVSAAQDRAIKLWDAEKGYSLRTLRAADKSTGAIAVSSGGRVLATAHADGTVRLIALPGGTTTRVLGRPRSLVTSLDLGPHASSLAVAQTGQPLLIWDLRSGLPRWVEPDRAIQPLAVSFASHAPILAVVGRRGELRAWHSGDLRVIRTFPDDLTRSRRVSMGPNGKTVAVGNLGAVQLWDVATGKLIRALPPGRDDFFVLQAVTFSPRGELLASAIASTRTSAITVWQPSTGKKLADLSEHEGSIRDLAFSPKEPLLASASLDGTVRLWDLSEPRSVRVLKGPHAPLRFESMAFTPSGRRLLCGLRSGDIQIWSVSSGKLLQTLHGHSGLVSSLSLAPNGKVAVSGSWDGTIKLWDLASKSLLLTAVTLRPGEWAAFTPDGYVDASAKGRSLIQWKVGDQRFFHQVGWQRYHVPGLVARVIAGDTAFRLSHLRALTAARGARGRATADGARPLGEAGERPCPWRLNEN